MVLVKKRSGRMIGKGGLKRNRSFVANVVKKITSKGKPVDEHVEDIDGDAKWEELFSRPASGVLLAVMSQSAGKEFNAGQTEEGGFGDLEDSKD